MLSKTKKIALLTTGLVGALVTSSAVGVALSSCTTNSTSTEVEDNTKYNTYINWSDPSTLSNLVVDENGLVYSDIYKTTVIAVTPSFTGTTITVPASVRSITGYTEVLPSGATIVRGAFQPAASFTPEGSNTTQSGVTLNNLISTVKFAANSQLKSIGAYAFYGCTLLQSIDLPTTVTMIGNSAFYGCTLLGAINLTNVEYVGSYAFTNLATSLVNPTISISLNKAAVIGNNAFENASITSVDFSANTTLISMGNYAFSGCSSLTGTVDLSKATSLTSTGTNTFQNCSGITAVNLPSSLRIIGESAFSGCSSIANTIDLSGANKLSTIGNNAFQNCTKLTGLSYPVSAPITSFGANAFSGCSALTQLGTVAGAFTAPAALTSIAANAFSGTSITSVNISNMSVAEPFQASSLAGMTSLTSVNLGTSITTLPANLFAGDTALKTITLPTSITSVITNPTDSSAAITTADGYSAFYGSSLETVDMSAITSYSTTSGATTVVPNYLFAGLTSLKNVVLKTGTTAIDNYAFQNTSGLTSVREASQNNASGFITMGTLTRIGNNAFQGTGLTSFTLSAISNNESDSTSTTFSLGQYAFADATKLTNVDLSASGLTTIPQYVFNNATALTTINMPSAPASSEAFTIEEGAFNGLTSLTSINLSAYSNLVINTNNFNNATALTDIDLTGLTSIPSFISSSNYVVFKGISSTATVKLSSAINTITNTDVFTKAVTSEGSSTPTYTRVSLEYPNGVTFTANGDNPQINNTGVLSNVATLLSNVTGDLNLSSNTSLTSMGTNTLFGNANITSLTLSASSIISDTNLYTLNTSVNAVNPSNGEVSVTETTNQYTTDNVPLGNNIGLTSINFTNFPLTGSMVGPGALKQETFNAIAKIMNSYAYYSGTSSQSNVSLAALSDSVNFKNWATENNAWIQSDALLTYQSRADENNTGGTINLNSNSNVTATDSSGQNVTTLEFTKNTSVSYTLTHNNIKWNLVYNADTNLLTLTTNPSTPANIYKGYVSTDTSVQVYIKTTNNDGVNIDTSGVQVKMSFNLTGQ